MQVFSSFHGFSLGSFEVFQVEHTQVLYHKPHPQAFYFLRQSCFVVYLFLNFQTIAFTSHLGQNLHLFCCASWGTEPLLLGTNGGEQERQT